MVNDPRIREAYDRNSQSLIATAEKAFAVLFVFQWLVGILFALLISPRVWVGPESHIHVHVYAAIFLGGLLTSLPVFFIFTRPHQKITRHTVAIAQMLFSILLIHLTEGRIETHFHVFVSLAFLSYFRDRDVLVTATLTTVLTHLAGGFFWPESMYGVVDTSILRTLEHGAWVVFEDFVLFYSIRISSRDAEKVAISETLLIDKTARLKIEQDNALRLLDEIKDLNVTLENRVIERTQKIKELQSEAESIAQRFRGVFDNAAVGIVAINREYKCILVNPAFAKMIGYTQEELSHLSIVELTHPDDRQMSAQAIHMTPNRPSTFQKRYIKKNGTILWAKLTATTINDKDSALQSISVIEDITAQREAGELIKQQQQELQASDVRNAHAAGMSEVATGVLHNVGNVLNSTNVSVETLLKRLGDTNLDGLHRANALLKANLDSFDMFYRNDPRGKKLLEYYLQLDTSLEQDFSDLRSETQGLMKGLRLIKDIINTQQSYAKGSHEYREKISLVDVVEMALTMQRESLRRHEIRVVKKFADVNLVPAQKTKLTHILINLIKNAKESMTSGNYQERVLSLEISQTATNHVVLKIGDTGGGIDPENINKVFSHGFTTKTSGHGFGLHFCANAMVEMGGQIAVTSEGLGAGAQFTLTFDNQLPKADAA